MFGIARQRLELRLEDATVADEPRENRPELTGNIAGLILQRRADNKEAPGDDVRSVIDQREAIGLIPTFLIGPDQMMVIKRRAVDEIAADVAIELGKDEFAVLKREHDDPCLCRNRIDQQGFERGV